MGLMSDSDLAALTATLGPGTEDLVKQAQAALDKGDTAGAEKIMAQTHIAQNFEVKDGKIQRKPDHYWRNSLITADAALTAGALFPGVLSGAGFGSGTSTPALTATTSGLGGTLPATGTIGATAGSGIVPAVASPGIVGSATGGGVLSGLGGYQGLARTAGAGLSGIAKADANNRGTALDAALVNSQQDISRSTENRNARNDAWRGLMHSEYMQNRPQYAARQGLPTFGTTPGQTTPAMLEAARGVTPELMTRLTGGPQLQRPDISQYSKPGGFARIASYAAPFLGAFGGR